MTITVGYPPANALTSGSINSQPVVPVGANISDAGSIPVMVKSNPLTGVVKTLAVLTQAQYDALVAAGTIEATTNYKIVAA